jgi:hypothetical protein
MKLYKYKDFRIDESSDTDKLIQISDDLSERMYCDRHGSCVHFAEEFVLKVNSIDPGLLEKFFVVEGFVDWQHGDGIPQQHTWIELMDKTKIDPSFKQFSKYGRSSYTNRIKNKFTGLEYYEETLKGTWFSERRKKHPSYIFKDH